MPEGFPFETAVTKRSTAKRGDSLLDLVNLGAGMTSVLDLDVRAASVPSLSPRSREACESLGILPTELLMITDPAKLPSSGSDLDRVPAFQQKRLTHYEEKRQAKYDACISRREELLRSGSPSMRRSSSAADTSVDLTSAVVEEQRRVRVRF